MALLSACGEPPQPQPTSPTYATASAAPVPLDPALPTPATQPLTPPATVPTYATTYPPLTLPPPATIPPATIATLAPTTTAPTEKSPTPTPSHAPKCTTVPTGPEIVALAKKEEGMAKVPLVVQEGPFCSGTWSFTALGLKGVEEDPFMIVATGSGATLTRVAAGSEVCINPVQNSAPPGIRVLACGF
ncbi:hypothetical protein [Actinoplanes sp. NPDC048796]|uniref:hypothetical protein n=1 Tax=Actinoplanes sp. NPDC048796 TaxID=3155640 RepID=UPI0033FEBD0B